MGLIRLIVPLSAALVVAGCGYKSNITRLEPRDPAMTKSEHQDAKAAEKAAVERGLKPGPEGIPERVDDLSISLGVRSDDAFNLPPEGTKGGTPIPFPGDRQPVGPTKAPAQPTPEA